jgi:hypothetical protein
VLSFFFTRHNLPNIETSGAFPFKVDSAEKYRNKVIPFSHIYITSRAYQGQIKKSLGDEEKEKLVFVSKPQVKMIQAHRNFPVELASLGIQSLSELKEKVAYKDEINIVIVNGIGTGFGDNYVGLGSLQRLSELLAPVKINFHLMQNMNKRAAPIYMREANVFIHNNCITVKKFMQMDFYVNLTYMLGFTEFDEKPLSQFMAYSFLVDKFSTQQELQPKLKFDVKKLDSIRLALSLRFEEEKPIVLFHPKASSPVRTMKKKIADKFVDALIDQGFNVVIAIPYSYSSPNMCHFDDLSQNIDDLLHITKLSDAVISVGTVLYHLSGALNKPTILLPTVKADVDSGELLPSVITWVPEKNHGLIMNIHKSREEEDIHIAKQIWENIDPKEVAKSLFEHIDSYD